MTISNIIKGENMQVFHIEADKLKYIDESPFRSEKKLQKL